MVSDIPAGDGKTANPFLQCKFLNCTKLLSTKVADPDPYGSGSVLEWKAGSGSALKSNYMLKIEPCWSAVDAHIGGVESQTGALEGL